MPDKPWKRFEREVAAMIGGERAWANALGAVDCASDRFLAQCKLVSRLSLDELTTLVETIDKEALADNLRGDSGPPARLYEADTPRKLGVVCVKVKRGRGFPSPTLVVMSEETFKRLSGYTTDHAER